MCIHMQLRSDITPNLAVSLDMLLEIYLEVSFPPSYSGYPNLVTGLHCR